MATTTKAKDGTIKKEKKLTPSSTSQATIRAGTTGPKPTIKSSITDKDKLNPSTKSLPNYLKPTARTESLKNVKVIDQDLTQKRLVRRSSLDGPVRLQKSVISSDLKERAGSRNRPTTTAAPAAMRSSSFSVKSSAISPALNRSSNSLNKPVKSQPLPATKTVRKISPLKRSVVSAKSENKSKPASGLLETPTIPTLELETKQGKDEEPLTQEELETANPESEVQVLPDIPKPENEEPVDNACQDNKIGEHEKLEDSETSNISEVHDVESTQEAQVEEIENETNNDEVEHEHEITGEENHENNIESSHGDVENGTGEEAKVEPEDISNADLNVEEFAEESENKRVDDNEELKLINVGKKEEILEGGETPISARQGGSQRKKDSPVYNDVIEETKKKLMEKRKNKVKALVGAFETVIDYETAGSA